LNQIIYSRTFKKELNIRKKQRWIINTGGFMEGYVKDRVTHSYVENKNLPPCALGYSMMEIKLVDKLRHIKDKRHNEITFTPYVNSEKTYFINNDEP